MRLILLSVAPLLCGIGLATLSTGMLSTILGIRVTLEGYSPLVAGGLGTAYFAGQLLGSLVVHRLMAKVGHIRVFSAFASMLAAITLLHGLIVDPVVWLVLRFLAGLSIAAIFVCTESWLNERTGNDTRGRVLSLYMITVYSCVGGGQFLITLYAPDSFSLLALVSVLISLALMPVALSTQAPPSIPQANAISLVRLWRESPAGMVGSLGAGLVLGSFYSLSPVYAQAAGFDANGIAHFVGCGIFGGLLMQWPVGRVSDRVDRRLVLVALFIALACASLLLTLGAPLLGPSWALLAASAAFGGFSFVLYPVAVSHVFDRIPNELAVQAAGAMLLTYSIGATLGPLAASALMMLTGPLWLYVSTAAVAAVGMVIVLLRMTQRAPTDEDSRNEYRAMPPVTPSLVVHEMDPRIGGPQP